MVMKEGAAAHVARITRRYKDRSYDCYLVRQSYRDNGQVKHRTLANLSKLPLSVIQLVQAALQGQQLAPVDEIFDIQRSRPHGHVAAVLATLRQLSLERMLDRRPSRARALAVALVAARILEPRSKLATAGSLHPATLHHTLAESLDVEAADEDELYATLDWLLERQEKIEQTLAKQHLGEGTLVLYDLTSTYFEGRTCPLARRGHSRDGKKNRLQIVVGLMTNADGCPVAVEVFAGNTADPATVKGQLDKLRERFGLRQVVLVADRGTLTTARLCEDVAPTEVAWITALRSAQIRKLVADRSIQLSLFDEKDLVEIHHPAYPGERLMVCRNPLLAAERQRKREALLEATEKELAKIAAAVTRQRRPLRGEAAIGQRLGRVVSRYKMAKHFRFEIGEDRFHFERDEAKIAAEAVLDGLYVIRTTLGPEAASAEKVVSTYKSLGRVEQAFRTLKSIRLKIRPIYHRLEDRVRAHVLLCMLAYYVEWHMRRKLAPLLYDEEDRAGQEARRRSVVEPARRSQRTESKVARLQTEEGLPVQSFQSLLQDLATLCKNRVVPRGTSGEEGSRSFDLLTTPTALQQRAFDLLGVNPARV